MIFSALRTKDLFLGCLLFITVINTAKASEADLIAPIRPYVAKLTSQFSQIPVERQKELKKAALFIRSKIQAKEPAKLTFICTHNSRRSHLAQIWTQTAAAFYGIEGVEAYSGGTEATAMNTRTVDALRRVGFSITDSTGGTNPIYLTKYADNKPQIRGYSKVYNAEENPKSNYAALMTCSQADKNCPVVEGSTIRIPIHYEDPKVADNTPEETARYDERTEEIGREMFYLMSQVKG